MTLREVFRGGGEGGGGDGLHRSLQKGAGSLNIERLLLIKENQLSQIKEFGAHLEKAMAPHSSTLAWKIPRTEKPGRLQSMGSLKVGHD